MTFGQIKQAVFDKLGLTSETTLVERMVNETQQEIAASARWGWLESSGTQLFTSGTSLYAMGTDASELLGLQDADGQPLDFVQQDGFMDLYQADTSTATNPTIYTLRGMDTSNNLKFAVWPVPGANTSGTRRYLRRLADMTTTADVPNMPVELHPVIVAGALTRFAHQEDDQRYVELKQTYDAMIAGAKQRFPEVAL